MKENLEKVKLLAHDLQNGKEFPRARVKRWAAICSQLVWWTTAP